MSNRANIICASCEQKEPYTLEKALDLARDLVFGSLTPPKAATPTLEEAEVIINERLKTSGFNWITGRVALKMIKEARKNKKSISSNKGEIQWQSRGR